MAVLAASTPNNPFDRLDGLAAKLGTLQLQILGQLTLSNQKHQAIDAEFSQLLNSLYREAQETFDEIQRLCGAHRAELLRGDKKSATRNTGTVGWRSVPRLTLHIPEEDLIARLRTSGQSIYRRFVRVTRKYELNKDAFLTLNNKAQVEKLEGVEVTRDDDFYVQPSAGVRMSSAHKLWPNLEGQAGPKALNTLISSTDA